MEGLFRKDIHNWSCFQQEAWNENTGHGANGVVFKAKIRQLDEMPASEMAEVQTFDVLPESLTYPAITPVLFRYLADGDKGICVHQMKLKAEPFRKIKDGLKIIELRLNDEKRQKVQAGDFIEFSPMNDPSQKLITRVVSLHHFADFRELYASLSKEKLGYSAEETPEPDHSEIRSGEKVSHWMWYVFPQIQGLGWSGITAHFSIKDLTEAVEYIQHPILGKRLVEISSELLKLDSCDPTAVMSHPDDFKLRSSMTLFKYAASEEPVFQKVLDKYCMGMEDDRTTAILKKQE